MDEVSQANNARVVAAQASAADFVDTNNEGSTTVDAPAEFVARPAVEGELASENDVVVPAEEV